MFWRPVLTLPEIDRIENAGDRLSLHFVVSRDLEYFQGHFPDLPLLPGVVQIGWALELARRHFGASAEGALDKFRSLSGVKFMRVIQPDASVCLRLSVNRESRELDFEFTIGDYTCSSGRVRFH